VKVDITYLGEFMEGPLWQAQPQELNSSFADTPDKTREAFVAAWNQFTGQNATQADFTFVQQGGPPEEETG
jgi:hypothetical protein